MSLNALQNLCLSFSTWHFQGSRPPAIQKPKKKKKWFVKNIPDQIHKVSMEKERPLWRIMRPTIPLGLHRSTTFPLFDGDVTKISGSMMGVILRI
jgi:hypothetical protein